MSAAPTLNLQQMMIDPLPTFAALRAQDRWMWSDEMQMWVVARYDDVVHVDTHSEIFSADLPGLATRTLGTMMVRSEGSQHRRLRSAGDAPLKRRALDLSWTEVIAGLVDDYLAPLRAKGRAELVQDFASPFTGAVLREVLGLREAEPLDVARWSDAFISGVINNADDPDVWRVVDLASQECRNVVALAVDRVRDQPDFTVVSAMANNAASSPLTVDEIAANIRLMIAGGFNDARDAVAILTALLLQSPETLRRVRSDDDALERSIDESIRWLSPVGSFPRVLTRDICTSAADLRTGERVLVLLASANHDERKFQNPAVFDIDRPGLSDHLGFSTGLHYCLGSHLVRAMMRAAVPALLDLPDIALLREPAIVGWQFRGPDAVSVAFSTAGSAGVSR